MQNTMFPEMDKQTQLNTHYYCRDDIKWLGFAFLYGVLYGVDGQVPGKDHPGFHRYMDLDTEAFGYVSKQRFIT